MSDQVGIVLTIVGLIVIVAMVFGVAVLLRGDDVAADDPARAEKQRLRDEKAAERHHQRQAEQQAKAAKLAEDRKRAGTRVHSANFGGKAVEIYANGYVRVAMFMRDAVPFQKLLSIEVESNVQKKTGPGRVVAASMTFGANLVLTPNKRGDVYVTIVTEGDVYVLRASPPTIFNIKAAQGIAAAGAGVLKRAAARSDELPRVTGPTRVASAEKECPYCAETIKAAAIKCRYCGSDLS